MKKYFLYAAAALSLAACTNDEVISNPSKEKMVFTASMEDAGTRTEIDGNSVSWVGDETICINGESYSTTSTGTEASFTADGDEAMAVDGKFNAYYPASLYSEGILTLPAKQEYDAVGASNPMYAQSTNNTLHFNNLCGVIKLNLTKQDVSIKSIRLEANENMSGRFSVNMVNEKPLAVISAGHKYVIQDCTQNVDISTTSHSFFFAVPAGTYTGFKIVMIASDNTSCTKTLKGSLVIERNKIQPITFVDNQLEFVGGGASSVLYYNENSTTTAANAPFDVNVTYQYYFKHAFPGDEQHPAFDFGAGAVVETKIKLDQTTLTNGTGRSIFSFGGHNAWGNAGVWGAISALIRHDTENHKWKCEFTTGNNLEVIVGSAIEIGNESDYTNNQVSYMWIRISQDGGLEYSFNGSSWTQVVNKNDTYVSAVLARGLTNTDSYSRDVFYMGAYCGFGFTVHYEYLKVSTGGADSGPAAEEIVPTTGVSLNSNAETLGIGDQVTLTASVEPTGATTKDVTWTSSDESVATVSGTGVVTAVAGGTATITATTADGGYTASCAVTVQSTSVQSVSFIDTGSYGMTVGEELDLNDKITFTPSNAANKNVSWTIVSQDPEGTVSLDSDGVVTALQVGTATIQVTTEDGSKTAQCTITVSEPLPVAYYYYDYNTSSYKMTDEATAFDVSGDGYCIDLNATALNLNAGDELEIMFTHNGKDTDRFLCIGNKDHFVLNNGIFQGSYGGTCIYFSTNNNNVWFNFRNSHNCSLADSNFNSGYLNRYSSGVKINSSKIQYYMAVKNADPQWVDATEAPANGDKGSEALAKLKACSPLSIGSFGTFNEATKTQIDYIKVTKASTRSAGVGSSSAAPVSTKTQAGW